MKKQSDSLFAFPARVFSMRQLSAAAVLCCATLATVTIATAPLPALAQSDEAALNFVGADIESVIKAVGHYTNINFVIDPRVKGTITLVSEKSITKSQAFSLLTSALRLQGFAVVTGDGYAKVVPEAEAKLQSVPTKIGGGPSKIKGDQVITQVFNLNYESAANMMQVLRPLITPNNTINANPGNNSLVITDYADNLQRLSKIIAALDAPASSNMDVIPIRYAIANDVATMVNKLMDAGGTAAGAGGDSSKVSVLADPRTNSVVLRAPSAARGNLAKSLVAKLDQPTSELGNVHVVYLKNAEATKLAQTLRSVVSFDTSSNSTKTESGTGSSNGTGSSTGSSSSSSSSTSSTSGSSNSGPQNSALTGDKQSGSQSQSSGGAGGYIQADASTNTLIITASEPVYRNLRNVIDQLDARRAQVYIEALIVEVSATTASEFGIQLGAVSGSSTSSVRVGALTSFNASSSSNIVTLATNAAAGTYSVASGLTAAVFNSSGLGAVIHALESDSNTNILSTPNLITLDNELASIKVGQNVPILTGQYTTSTTTSTTNPFQTYDRKDVGLVLKVRPQISEGGTIKLAIYQESSSVDQTTLTSTSGVTINNRVIENNVIADDGQIIVIGGLIDDNTSNGDERVHGLASIPIIGNLFKSQTRARTKTNLMVFLRPVIIRSKDQSNSLAADRYDFMRAAQKGSGPQDTNIMMKDLGAPALPDLKSALPPGGTLAIPPAPLPAPARNDSSRPASPATPATPGDPVTPAAPAADTGLQNSQGSSTTTVPVQQ
jgi:general secretion pathway protein D